MTEDDLVYAENSIETPIQCVAAEVRRLRKENVKLRTDSEMADGCLDMIRRRLSALGCECPTEAHAATPPMMYDDWICCVVRAAVQRETIPEADRLEIARLVGEYTEAVSNAIASAGFTGIQQPHINKANAACRRIRQLLRLPEQAEEAK